MPLDPSCGHVAGACLCADLDKMPVSEIGAYLDRRLAERARQIEAVARQVNQDKALREPATDPSGLAARPIPSEHPSPLALHPLWLRCAWDGQTIVITDRRGPWTDLHVADWKRCERPPKSGVWMWAGRAESEPDWMVGGYDWQGSWTEIMAPEPVMVTDRTPGEGG